MENYKDGNLRYAAFIINGMTHRASLGLCRDIFDIPEQVTLVSKIDLCGYISPEGEYFRCGHFEHEKFVQTLVVGDMYEDFISTDSCFYNSIPDGMLKEEYFLMKRSGFIKISSFKEAVDEMYLLHYYPLTAEQMDVVYPR